MACVVRLSYGGRRVVKKQSSENVLTDMRSRRIVRSQIGAGARVSGIPMGPRGGSRCFPFDAGSIQE